MSLKDFSNIDISDVQMIFDNAVEIGKVEALLAVAESTNDVANVYDARRTIIRARDNINGTLNATNIFYELVGRYPWE